MGGLVPLLKDARRLIVTIIH